MRRVMIELGKLAIVAAVILPLGMWCGGMLPPKDSESEKPLPATTQNKAGPPLSEWQRGIVENVQVAQDYDRHYRTLAVGDAARGNEFVLYCGRFGPVVIFSSLSEEEARVMEKTKYRGRLPVRVGGTLSAFIIPEKCASIGEILGYLKGAGISNVLVFSEGS